jgi:hypothetical protein
VRLTRDSSVKDLLELRRLPDAELDLHQDGWCQISDLHQAHRVPTKLVCRLFSASSCELCLGLFDWDACGRALWLALWLGCLHQQVRNRCLRILLQLL